MEAALFAQMISDKSIIDLKKMGYKYPQADMREFIALLQLGSYQPLPLQDFAGQPLVWLPGVAQVQLSAAKVLLTPQERDQQFGLHAMEEEIISTFDIEQIDTTRDSVRRILSGYAPKDENENRIYGMKKGLEFIANPNNKITEENIYKLYNMTVGDFLSHDAQLQPEQFYRHDSVYIVGGKVEHTGLPHQKLPAYMTHFVEWILSDNTLNDLLKAALLHFYVAYLHPYFDGNGRMARLLHLWYLKQQGYSSALFVPLSDYINKTRKQYYRAFTLVEHNTAVSGVLDVTPFLLYFIENVYNKLNSAVPVISMQSFDAALQDGNVTKKEKDLWQFVLSAYGQSEFSTKQLERDFGHAAYATIRSFVLKFAGLGLLHATHYGQRVRYRVVFR